jgi:hypothetical protein
MVIGGEGSGKKKSLKILKILKGESDGRNLSLCFVFYLVHKNR